MQEYLFGTVSYNAANCFFNNYNYVVLLTYLSDQFVPKGLFPYVNMFECLFHAGTQIWADVFYYLQVFFFFVFNSLELWIMGSTNFLVAKAITIAVKFLLCIAVLIFARGGIPRYRFDYLTKLGWIRFLSLVLLSFLIELFLLSML